MDPIAGQLLNLSNTAADTSLARLLSGGSQAGRILGDLGGGKASVLLGGRVFQLDLGMARIPVGQALLARLVGGQLQISLTGSQTGSGSQSANQLGTVAARPMAAILGEFGLPSSVTNSAVASALMAAGMPLTRDVILALARALGEVEQDQSGALAFLLGRGLPISPEMLANTSRLLSQRFTLGDSLAKIMQGLRGLDESLEELGEDIIPISRKQRFQEHGEQLAKHRQSWPQPESSGDEDNLEESKPAAAELADKLEKQEGEHRKNPEAAIVAGKPPDQNDLAGVLLLLQQDLAALQALIDAQGLNINLTSLLVLTQDTYEALAGERLGNIPKKDSDTPPVYYFSVPIQFEGEDRTLEFLFRQYSNRKEEGGDLILRFELSNLGPIRLQLGWREGMVTFTMRVQDEPTAESVRPELEKLQQALLGAGFRTGQLRVQSGYVPETLREEIDPDFVPPEDPQGLDVRG